ncbi:MAG: hypothetical protein H8F28_14605 [Fibrella sp.]|nr:hypothetical protein [Armatimonadota bacterium]
MKQPESAAPDSLEPRVKRLETAVRVIGGLNANDDLEIDKLQKSDKVLYEEDKAIRKNLESQVAALRAELKTQDETLRAKIDADVADALAKAEATIGRLADEIFGRLYELGAKQDELAAKQDDLSQKHDVLVETQGNLSKKLGELAEIVDAIRNPKPASELADARLPQYRRFSVEELKQAIMEDRRDVVVEIASRLNPRDANDGKVLSNLYTLVKDGALMTELITFAGSKAKPLNA